MPWSPGARPLIEPSITVGWASLGLCGNQSVSWVTPSSRCSSGDNVASMAWKLHAIEQMHPQVEYESYEKPGQYGDAQQTVQRFTDLDGAHAATVAKLSKGDKVRLEWDHNYVTRSENGGESKYPERVITALEPVS